MRIVTSTVLAITSVLLATCPLSAARPEVRGSAPRGWTELRDVSDDGRYVAHVGIEGRDMPLLVIRGNFAESSEAFDAFAGVLSGDWEMGELDAPTPAEQGQQQLLNAVKFCCGTPQLPPCDNFCWLLVTIRCSGPNGTAQPCIISTFGPGCKDENCGWLWCECPDAPTAVD